MTNNTLQAKMIHFAEFLQIKPKNTVLQRYLT